jgi:hypothetical protein
VSRRRAGIAEGLRVDTAVIRGTEAVVEVSQGCIVWFVALCVVDIERTGEARVSKRGTGDLTGHLGKGERMSRSVASKLCTRMLCYHHAVYAIKI